MGIDVSLIVRRISCRRGNNLSYVGDIVVSVAERVRNALATRYWGNRTRLHLFEDISRLSESPGYEAREGHKPGDEIKALA